MEGVKLLVLTGAVAFPLLKVTVIKRGRRSETIPHQGAGGQVVTAIRPFIGGQCKGIRAGKIRQQISSIQVENHALHARIGAGYRGGGGGSGVPCNGCPIMQGW